MEIAVKRVLLQVILGETRRAELVASMYTTKRRHVLTLPGNMLHAISQHMCCTVLVFPRVMTTRKGSTVL